MTEHLIHLNVESTDTRTADEIADAILAALSVVSDHPSLTELTIVCPLAETI
jgi:hypothetical protein